MSAEQRIKSFIDRILRIKALEDEAKADIREIYAEAKAEGFDKTIMGQVVAHIRKVEKLGALAVDESATLFDLYLDAYQASHTRAREGTEAIAANAACAVPHDPVTGEVFADQSAIGGQPPVPGGRTDETPAGHSVGAEARDDSANRTGRRDGQVREHGAAFVGAEWAGKPSQPFCEDQSAPERAVIPPSAGHEAGASPATHLSGAPNSCGLDGGPSIPTPDAVLGASEVSASQCNGQSGEAIALSSSDEPEMPTSLRRAG